MPVSVSRPVVTPIWPSVVYRSTDADELDAQYEGREQGFTYAREGHPNAAMLAEKIDWLEGARGGVITGSGMAAVSALFLGLLEAGDHVVAGDQLYGRSQRLLTRDLPRMGFAATLADATRPGQVEAAIRPETRLLLVELVSNPTLRIADIEGLARIAERYGLVLAVDNTFTTPLAFRPLEHGAHVVIHSVTKLLAGHADVTLGYIVGDNEQRNTAFRDAAVTWGLTGSPFDCWLAERGLYSFELRFERALANAKRLAEFLSTQDGVESVLYPGLESHPDHARAVALLGGNAGHFGNMVSFTLAGGRAAVNAFLRRAEHIAFAPTLGDIGTTLSHPASSSHRVLTPEGREALGIGEGFIRVSVGVENIDQLTTEFAAAIEASRSA
ncbi:MAG: aminotransferase class I/II-fold pyridoxal phosphate-dependent enzyme [Geminicoccaceae bacterium]|nr:aminotransferase class I/II-fold pyridoxal phosphate-dependent enzyme [Geminicoccaceae bacterium]